MSQNLRGNTFYVSSVKLQADLVFHRKCFPVNYFVSNSSVQLSFTTLKAEVGDDPKSVGSLKAN